MHLIFDFSRKCVPDIDYCTSLATFLIALQVIVVYRQINNEVFIVKQLTACQASLEGALAIG